MGKYLIKLIMFGIASVLILFHCVYSALRWRKFLQGNNQLIQSLPVDIIFECFAGVLLAIVAISTNIKRLKKLHVFQQSTTYDKVMERKNFRTYSHGRADILSDIVQKRMQGINYVDGI